MVVHDVDDTTLVFEKSIKKPELDDAKNAPATVATRRWADGRSSFLVYLSLWTTTIMEFQFLKPFRSLAISVGTRLS